MERVNVPMGTDSWKQEEGNKEDSIELNWVGTGTSLTQWEGGWGPKAMPEEGREGTGR